MNLKFYLTNIDQYIVFNGMHYCNNVYNNFFCNIQFITILNHLKMYNTIVDIQKII